MNEIMEKIKEGILDLFPEIGEVPITAEMCLGDIPEYDSMAAVNLQTFLEENFPLKVSLDMLAAEMTLGELASYIARFVKTKP
ncbi:MAG TPA: acyl carrier protein [Syntrophales bacterium]|jgi:acyl carrier protein|nr:acyl carrier protein [Syntrophales bacterium]HRT61561.1 acyl carrier protein [Syntrophales bacterium]